MHVKNKNVKAKKVHFLQLISIKKSDFLGNNFNTNRMEVNWNQFISCHSIRILKNSDLKSVKSFFITFKKEKYQ